jgi:hypothetical protein
MMYQERAKELIEKFVKITGNQSQAIECAKVMIDLILIDLSEYSNSLDRLRAHEWTQIKSYL